MRYLSRHCLIVLLLLTTFIVALDPVHPATTAAFGSFENSAFRVRWPDRWQEVRRTETNIVLYDGITEIQMVAVEDSQSPQTSVGQIANDWFTSVLTNVENATEVPGLATADDVRASTGYTYQYRASPASLIPYAAYFESRRIAPNVLLWIVVDTEWGAFNADSGYFADVLKSLEISGTPTDGEVSQTFSVPGWRISVPAASLTESSPTLGLSQQPGQLWLIVLADVVNWTNSESAFDTSTAQIVAEDGQRLVPSPLHSQSVALSLRLQSITGTDVAVPPGHGIRLPLVYQVPAGISDLVLAVGDEQLPLNDTLVLELAASTLPPEQLAPVLQEATITGLVGNSRIQLQRVDGTVIDAPLTGIALPDFRDCGGREAWTDALSLVGQRVLLESDQGILGVDHLWLWLDGHDGRHLLNQVLVERGHATVTALPETSRFASWLNHTETTASENQVGRWQSCRSSAVSPIASPLLGSVTFDVEAGVNPADAELVREGITLAERQFAVLFGQKTRTPTHCRCPFRRGRPGRNLRHLSGRHCADFHRIGRLAGQIRDRAVEDRRPRVRALLSRSRTARARASSLAGGGPRRAPGLECAGSRSIGERVGDTGLSGPARADLAPRLGSLCNFAWLDQRHRLSPRPSGRCTSDRTSTNESDRRIPSGHG
ncbi:MAG: hypothetical protein R2839_03285 [Thermomicrobiales bacterium]